MLKETYVIQASLLSTLHKKAKVLKKSLNIPHHQALDVIAKELRFANWEHLKKATSLTAISEESLKSGLIWAMDEKDNEPIKMDGIVEDNQASMLLLNNFVKSRGGGINPIDLDFIEDLLDRHVFYRYEGKTPNSFEEAIEISQKYFFFLPRFFWIKGEWFDMFGKFDYEEYLAERREYIAESENHDLT